MGTIVNVISIIAGSIIGTAIKGKFINKHIDNINTAIGLAVFVIGINGIITNTIYYDGNNIRSKFELIIILSLIIGVIIGKVFELDENINNMSIYMENKFKLQGFAKSFMTASILFSVGAMSILGALNDGLLNDPSLLYVKSALDFITSVILAASLGIGVLFSSIVVLIYQGGLTLLSSVLSPYLQGDLLNQICAVGFAVVLTISGNFLKITKIKTANFLPAMFVPILIYIAKTLVSKFI